MDVKSILIIALIALQCYTISGASIWSFIHDLVQNNIAGVPVLHERTEWEFDPDVGKRRRAVYEELNGIKGEKLISRIGMGIGFKGPWGKVINGRTG